MADEAASEHEIRAEERWPAVPLAYEFVRPSYEIMLKRFETVEGRIRGLATLTATLTFAAPAFIKAVRPEVSLTSPWFVLAIVVALAVAAIGVVATLFWTVRLYTPRLLYEQCLEWAEWEFQKNMLYWAGDAFEQNGKSLRRKGGLSDVMAVLFLAEVSLLIVWSLSPA